MGKITSTLTILFLAASASACGHNTTQRAAPGAATGAVVAGPVGAVVGAGVGAVVSKSKGE